MTAVVYANYWLSITLKSTDQLKFCVGHSDIMHVFGPVAPRNKSLAAKHLERIVSFAIHHPTHKLVSYNPSQKMAMQIK